MRLTLLLTVLSITACAGKVDYIKPLPPAPGTTNFKVVDRPREQVWNASVPELGKQFFVINNLDRSSGLINISYSGDPEKHVDCGVIKSYVKNMRGERTYNFPASRANQTYEIMDAGSGLFFVDRKMALEGRVNVIFEEQDGGAATKVTANTKYVLTRHRSWRNATAQFPQSSTDSISFNSGGTASFTDATECIPTGQLEQDILSAIK